MTQPSSSESTSAANTGSAGDSIGVLPDFHRLTSHSVAALESYMHRYVDIAALAESVLKSSIDRHAA